MEDKQIFVKTVEGEQAVRERTRLVQRNLRMVLILVEGHATVGQLKEKIGDGHIVESALVELEQMGLIETEAARRLRQDGGTPPALAARQVPERIEIQASEPVVTVTDTSSMGREDFATSEPQFKTVIRADDLFDSPDERREPTQKSGRLLGLVKLPESIARRRELHDEGAKEDVHRDADDGLHDAPAAIAVTLKPIRPAGAMAWPARIFMVAIAVVALLGLLLVTFPYDNYIPRVEAAVSRSIGSPVKIGGLRVDFLPYPNLTLDKITVGGEHPYFEAAHAHVLPDPLSLVGPVVELRRIDLFDVHFDVAGVDRTAGWFSGPAADFRIGKANLSNLTLHFPAHRVEALSGELTFSPDGTLAKASIRNADGTLVVDAEPHDKLFRLAVSGNAWRPPFLPGAVVTSIDAKGELTARQLRLPKVEARLFEGLIVGAGTLDWSDGYGLVGDFELKHANLAKLVGAFEPQVSYEGEVDYKARFEGRTKQAGQLANTVRIDGSFNATRVVLDRIDLVEAARANHGSSVGTGNTRVDRLSGALQCDGQNCRLSGLNMRSGLMSAGGRVSIARGDGRLEGSAEVAMLGSANQVRVPVAISGTLAYPQLTRR